MWSSDACRCCETTETERTSVCKDRSADVNGFNKQLQLRKRTVEAGKPVNNGVMPDAIEWVMEGVRDKTRRYDIEERRKQYGEGGETVL